MWSMECFVLCEIFPTPFSFVIFQESVSISNAQHTTHTHTHTLKELDPEEREELQKEIQRLKDEISSMKSGSLLGDQQPKDIVRKCGNCYSNSMCWVYLHCISTRSYLVIK